MRKIKKQANQAPKFILAAFDMELQGYVFVADKNKVDSELTVNVSKALAFSYGFDDETIKEKAWSLSTGREFMAIPA